MPGLTLVVADDSRTSDELVPDRARGLLLHGPHYRACSAAAAPGIDVGWVAYERYPALMFRSSDCVVYLEGRIYNRTVEAVRADLAAFADPAFDGRRHDAAIERFVLSSQGAYVVAIIRPASRHVLIFTDPFARLPLYYSSEASRLIVAREPKFIRALRPELRFDRMGCAQFLTFGLPLGDRTLLDGVKSFPEAGILEAEVGGGRLRTTVRSLRLWNLDDVDDGTPLRRHASDFRDLFLPAVRAWGTHSESRGNLVSLSGGHDSRAVAAALAETGTPLIALTYRDPSGQREDEVRCARQLARRLDVEWHCIDLPIPTESAYEELAWLKDGMNWASMAYILAYLETIVGRWGRDWSYFSGDGGDDCLKVTAPRARFGGTEELAAYLVENETYARPSTAEGLLALPPGSLEDELRRVLASYPEQDLALRIKHYKIFERGRRCYFEGEDRTRFFLWQDSPFYSLPLFKQAMRVPDRLKWHNVFCREVLSAVSPAAASVPVSASGHAPASWRYALHHRLKDALLELPEPLVTIARRLTARPGKTPYRAPDAFVQYVRTEYRRDETLAPVLRRDELLAALPHYSSARGFFCLWTIIMLEKAYRSRFGDLSQDAPGTTTFATKAAH